MKKNTKLHIPVSSDLKDALKKRADSCQMTLTAYCRLVLERSKPKILFEEEID